MHHRSFGLVLRCPVPPGLDRLTATGPCVHRGASFRTRGGCQFPNLVTSYSDCGVLRALSTAGILRMERSNWERANSCGKTLALLFEARYVSKEVVQDKGKLEHACVLCALMRIGVQVRSKKANESTSRIVRNHEDRGVHKTRVERWMDTGKSSNENSVN